MQNKSQNYFNSHHLLALMNLSGFVQSGWQRNDASRSRNLTVTPIRSDKEFGFVADFSQDGQNPRVRTKVSWIAAKQLAVLTYRTDKTGEKPFWGDIVTVSESGEGQNRRVTLLDKFCRETSLRRIASAILAGGC